MKRFTIGLLSLMMFLITNEGMPQAHSRIDNFVLTDVINNRPVSLADFKSEKGVVLIFTSIHCPYDKLYEGRIKSLAQEFVGRGIQFLLINSNASSEDNAESIERMAALAKQKNYSFPYLADKDQKVATLFNATKTPEVFVLQNNGEVFTLKYRGAIDDNPQMPTDVSAYYAREAIQAVINKSNVSVAQRRPTGCMIKSD